MADSASSPASGRSRAAHAGVVAVVGGSGAGKSWLVQRLRRFFGPRACHVQLDDFYLDRSRLPWGRRKFLNFDVPAAIDWAGAEQVLRACRTGAPVFMPSYDFVTHCVIARRAWRPRPVVIVEGLWWLRRRSLRPLIDLKLYLDVPDTVRCARRLKRDVAERGFTLARAKEVLQTQVLPLHGRYVEAQKRAADLVLRQPYGDVEFDALARALWRFSERGSVATEPTAAFRARLRRVLTEP
jgi:uridine kinase